VRAFLERGVDGLVIFGTAHDEAVMDLVRRRGLPLVTVWELAACARLCRKRRRANAE